jgi:alanine racemase
MSNSDLQLEEAVEQRLNVISPDVTVAPNSAIAEGLLRERAWVEIDLAALAQNIQQLRQFVAPRSALMAVVKADAYGHGAELVAKTALQHGVSWLGVATVPEGIALRKAGIQAPILILGATNLPEQVRALVHWQLQPTLCSPKQALVFSDTISQVGQTLPVHLKIDTGMSRLGTSWEQAVEFAQLVHGLPGLEIASIYSHLATADSLDSGFMTTQHRRYENAIAQIRKSGIAVPKLHLANSAATLTSATLHYDMVRTGLAIYGLYPASHLRSAIDLQPVMQVKARITQVKTIPPGSSVSYGQTYTAQKETRIAVVGIGYADGVLRSLSNQVSLLVQGQRVPQIGAITMDQLMLDVSTVPDVQEGEVVTLIGRDGDEYISAEEWANTLGTISWEVLCGFKHRLPRVAVQTAQSAAVLG